MNENDLYRSFQELDDDILERSERITKKSRKNSWIKWAVMAVFLGIVIITVTVTILREDAVYVEKNSTYGFICRLKKRYNKEIRVSGNETPLEWEPNWPEEYRPLYEECSTVTFHKKTYDTKTSGNILALIDKKLLGDVLGTCEAKEKNGDILEETLSVREILGVSSDLMIAVEMEGKYYVFQNEIYGTKTLGDMLSSYGLPQVMDFQRFEWNDEFFTLNEDEFVWEMLTECSDAKYVSNPPENNSETICFTVTSESLGIFLKQYTVRADGYVSMNGTFFIGEEAAKEIIDYVKENSQKAGYDPQKYSLAGTFFSARDGYIVLDDAVLCRNKYKGKTFRINLEDHVDIRRYFECGKIQRGQLFIISFSGTINEETGEIEVGPYCSLTTDVRLYSESWFDILRRNLEVVLVDEIKN